MSLIDYFKGPAHKANLHRLENELHMLQRRHADLERLAKESGALDLQIIRDRIRAEEKNLENIRAQTAEANAVLQAAQDTLFSMRQQILVLEETILLESFALYEPKFKLRSSAEYKDRLDNVRAKQKD